MADEPPGARIHPGAFKIESRHPITQQVAIMSIDLERRMADPLDKFAGITRPDVRLLDDSFQPPSCISPELKPLIHFAPVEQQRERLFPRDDRDRLPVIDDPIALQRQQLGARNR